MSKLKLNYYTRVIKIDISGSEIKLSEKAEISKNLYLVIMEFKLVFDMYLLATKWLGTKLIFDILEFCILYKYKVEVDPRIKTNALCV